MKAILKNQNRKEPPLIPGNFHGFLLHFDQVPAGSAWYWTCYHSSKGGYSGFGIESDIGACYGA